MHKGNYYEAYFEQPQGKSVSASALQNLKVYEALMEFSHVSSPDGLYNTSISHGDTLRMAATVGRVRRSRVPRTGEGVWSLWWPGSSWRVKSFWWPPNTFAGSFSLYPTGHSLSRLERTIRYRKEGQQPCSEGRTSHPERKHWPEGGGVKVLALRTWQTLIAAGEREQDKVHSCGKGEDLVLNSQLQAGKGHENWEGYIPGGHRHM